MSPRLVVRSVRCELTLSLPEKIARVCAEALAPDTHWARGARARVKALGGTVHIEIRSDTISRARAALSSYSSLVRAAAQAVEAAG